MSETVHSYDALFQEVLAKINCAHAPFLIAIAGPPATGKSTLAERLVVDLNAAAIQARFCPMDGFHLTNDQLDERGLREAKGRIDTFDGHAFYAAVQRLKDRTSFWWPIYSRQRHDPIPEGSSISGTEKVYVIEGNYVLSNVEPWRSAIKSYDLCIFVDAPDEVLHQRLLQRHIKSGRSTKQAVEKIELTDMPNAEVVRTERQSENILFCEHHHV